MISIVRRIMPDVEINVLAGQTVIVETPEDARLKVWRQADAATIATLFDRAAMGIFPASTVCVEAFARRLPVIAGHYVDNQEEFYAHGVKEGWFAPLGCLLDKDEVIEERLRKILADGKNLTAPAFDFIARKADITGIFKLLAGIS